LNLLLN
ncbi:hypothetical protein MIMGU_mgv1a0087052mg, partial [Erythranthe guttata]